ncbi:ABC transporter permease [Acholeplasma granularum]|uniref:ABC transporter permease n=1 Tax=Acholeplasma granularum TaxID=264635 RepID=UPI0004722550|nr:ABC transporter permease [Acholeplasma granularum]
MYSLMSMVSRNIKTYLRDKTAVFFSFLSVIILLGLYMLFLANNLKPTGMDQILTDNQITFMVYSQLIPGLLIINSVSIPLGNLGTMINDFEYRQIDGFLVTPIKRYKVILSYYLSSFIITVFISLLMLSVAFLLMGVATGIYVELPIYFKSFLLIVFYSFISTAIMVFITTFIRSVNAFGAVAGVFGTVVGFGSGIYMPLFILPDFMTKFASMLPFTHMNILLKQTVLPQAFKLIDPAKFSSIENYNETMVSLKEAYGFNSIGVLGLDIPMFIIMILCGVLSLILLALSTHLMNKRIKN